MEKKLKLKPIPKNTVVHTPTEAEARELLAILHENGYKWGFCSESLINLSHWNQYKTAMGYFIDANDNIIQYGDMDDRDNLEGYSILTLAEFKEKYVEEEKPQPKFKVGDRVKVVDYQKDCPIMGSCVGKVGTITSVSEEYKIYYSITCGNGFEWREYWLESYPDPPQSEVTISGWMCRDKDGTLCIYYTKPMRGKEEWFGNYDRQLPEDSFPSLTWESEPLRVKIEITPMEEKAQACAENKATALGLPPNNKFQSIYLSEVKKALKVAYLAGAKDMLSLPLSERLTKDERESIIKIYNKRIADIAKAHRDEAILYRGEVALLRGLFGDEFLNSERETKGK